jgi:hypothetical protein
MYNLSIQVHTEFTAETCCECGTLFAMTEQFQKNRRNNGGSFYCPNGHGMSYAKPRVELLEEELENKRKELTAEKCEVLRERALKEELYKNHKRLVKKGVCPCCRRSFINLKRHMNTKHPEYSEKKQGA